MGVEYGGIVEQLADEFIKYPIEFGTEADLRVHLYNSLVDTLAERGEEMATVQNPRLVGDTKSYKQSYKDVVEKRFQERGEIERVRLNASVGKRTKFDIIVFNGTVNNSVEWVRSGSKRFSNDDLGAAFGIKFIKNKCYPPTKCSVNSDELLKMDLEELQSILNTDENSLLGEFEKLHSLPDSVDTFFILVSNNNYLFADPLAESEESETKKQRVGMAAREWLRDKAGDITILYIHPRGKTWIS
ncbi:hypothetical protein [Saliphagus infecundisoli]|uniref:Uncharacterized protein n=1 Tax=Saliphagus infecundisoli TaxID=1849069 RepID=A0ABD5QBF1_9EURY|nr:hypothetical protein [Saliphagus infecundisoli]